MNRYLEEKILTAEPVELIRLVYQVAIASVRDARSHLREGKIAKRATSINCAWKAVAELNGALDAEVAPELVIRFRDLYLYIQGRLVQANCEQSDDLLSEVLVLLTTLSEGWAGVVEQTLHTDTQRFNSVYPIPVQIDRVAVTA